MKKAQPTIAPMLYSRSQVAVALNLSERSVDLLIRSGRLAHTKVGKRILLPASAVAQFAQTGTAHLIRVNNDSK